MVFELSQAVVAEVGALEGKLQLPSLISLKKDWESHFGGGSQMLRDAEMLHLPLRTAVPLTPEAVSQALKAQAMQLQTLQRQLTDTSGSSLAGGSSSEAAALRDETNRVLANMREQHDLALQQVIQEKDAEHHKAAEMFKKSLNDSQLELLNNRQHMINTEAQWRRRLEEVEQRERAEVARIKDHYEGLLARAKSETAAALEGLGSAVAAGAAAGNLDGVHSGGAGGEGTQVSAADSEKIRSLAVLLEESRKEAKWLRDRTSESERIIEALRKTIMRQAELSSQRDNAHAAGPKAGGGARSGGGGYAAPPPNRPLGPQGGRGGPRGGDWQGDRAPPHHHRGDRDHYNNGLGLRQHSGPGARAPPAHVPPPHLHGGGGGGGGYGDPAGGLPDRSWSRSAPLPLPDAPDRSRSAPLPEHQAAAHAAAAAAQQHALLGPPMLPLQQPQQHPQWDLRGGAVPPANLQQQQPRDPFMGGGGGSGAFPMGLGAPPLHQQQYGGGAFDSAPGYGAPLPPPQQQQQQLRGPAGLTQRSNSSPVLNMPGSLLGGGGVFGALGGGGGGGGGGGDALGGMRMPQPRQSGDGGGGGGDGGYALSRAASVGSLNFISEDAHEYEPGAGELDTATSVLGF
ncbi:hypothetical protein JKP88DRAFT_265792 [Tribonema minus]|uniref:Uncharacterized protein n=1 Tax=Tribonema minus TaxID=303371 RepID=A0A835YKF1_9STRA|nr:hypothetical protein JKP88DRAFT_265792 [Tribonema minus]